MMLVCGCVWRASMVGGLKREEKIRIRFQDFRSFAWYKASIWLHGRQVPHWAVEDGIV